MLYSAKHHIAFAHYPKTGGGSISTWFSGAFPDAVEVCTVDCHVPVRAALAMLTGGESMPPWRRCFRPQRMGRLRAARRFDVRRARELRVFGVVRSPFDMLVSLFRWWRMPEHHSSAYHPLRNAAERGDFRGFVEEAVVSGRLQPYENFFDVGGLAWPGTRLLHFDALEAGLNEVLREFQIPVPVALPRLNQASPDGKTRDSYERQAGSLLPAVDRYFAWYHRHRHLFVRGDGPSTPRRKSA